MSKHSHKTVTVSHGAHGKKSVSVKASNGNRSVTVKKPKKWANSNCTKRGCRAVVASDC